MTRCYHQLCFLLLVLLTITIFISYRIISNNWLEIQSSVVDTEERVPIFDLDLTQDDDGPEDRTITADLMAEGSLHNSPLLQAGVHGLVTGPDPCLGFDLIIKSSGVFLGKVNFDCCSPLPHIGLCSFSSYKLVPQGLTKDDNIGNASRERAICPHNMARLDTHRYLVSQTRASKLVGEPFSRKWPGLEDLEVGPIYRDLADAPVIFEIPIIPYNLLKEETKR